MEESRGGDAGTCAPQTTALLSSNMKLVSCSSQPLRGREGAYQLSGMSDIDIAIHKSSKITAMKLNNNFMIGARHNMRSYIKGLQY